MESPVKRRAPAIIASLTALLIAGVAGAADRSAPDAGAQSPRELLQPPPEEIDSPISDRFALRGSYFQPSMNTQLRYDRSPAQQGTLISAEGTLGMDDWLHQGALEMMIRLTPRQRLRADYLNFSRTGDVALGQMTYFGKDIFLPDERVQSSMDVRVLGLTYTYSMFRHERWELGLGLGLHLLEARGEAEVKARFVKEKFSAVSPFPSLVLDGTALITRRLSLNARVQYLRVNVSNVEGGYQNYHADVQFRVRPNLSFGLGYSSHALQVEGAAARFTGHFFMRGRGPEAFARVSF
jgi:hypothetical protein